MPRVVPRVHGGCRVGCIEIKEKDRISPCTSNGETERGFPKLNGSSRSKNLGWNKEFKAPVNEQKTWGGHSPPVVGERGLNSFSTDPNRPGEPS